MARQCPQRRTLNAVGQQEGSEQEEEAEPPRVNPMQAINAVQTQRRLGKAELMFVKVNVQGEEVMAMVDSGATHNFIDEGVARRLDLRFTPSTNKIKTVNAEARSVAGIIRGLPVRLEAWQGRLNLTAMPLDDFDIILGVEFLETAKASVVPHLNGILILDERCPGFLKCCPMPEKVVARALAAMQLGWAREDATPTYLSSLPSIDTDRGSTLPPLLQRQGSLRGGPSSSSKPLGGSPSTCPITGLPVGTFGVRPATEKGSNIARTALCLPPSRDDDGRDSTLPPCSQRKGSLDEGPLSLSHTEINTGSNQGGPGSKLEASRSEICTDRRRDRAGAALSCADHSTLIGQSLVQIIDFAGYREVPRGEAPKSRWGRNEQGLIDKCQVERLLEQRAEGEAAQFLVKWKGLTMEESTWEDEGDLQRCTKAMTSFKKRQANLEALQVQRGLRKDQSKQTVEAACQDTTLPAKAKEGEKGAFNPELPPGLAKEKPEAAQESSTVRGTELTLILEKFLQERSTRTLTTSKGGGMSHP